jgi:hypothetical protein
VDLAAISSDGDGRAVDGDTELGVYLVAVEGGGDDALATDHGDALNLLSSLLMVLVVRAGASPLTGVGPVFRPDLRRD